MKHKRIIYIDPKLAKDACGSKGSLEALAVVLSIKTTFVNSIMRNATAVNVMQTLRIGYTRYNRAVSYAIDKGWLTRRGDNLIAGKLRVDKAYNIRFKFSRCFYRGKRRGGDIKAPYTLTELCNFIRQAVLLFHISKQNTVYDTVTMATHPSAKQKEAMKASKRRLRRWGMCEPRLKGKARRLSYARMSEIAGCSKSKSKSLIKILVNDGVIEKKENFKRTNIDVEDYRANGSMMRELHFEAKKRGCIVYHEGRICVRLANSYTIKRNPISFKYDRKVS